MSRHDLTGAAKSSNSSRETQLILLTAANTWLQIAPDFYLLMNVSALMNAVCSTMTVDDSSGHRGGTDGEE